MCLRNLVNDAIEHCPEREAAWEHIKVTANLTQLSLPSMPALNCSLAWDPDSRRFPLQAFGFISPSAPGLSALLRDSPHAPKKKDPRHSSGALGAACLIPSEETAGKLPSKTHLRAAFPPEVLSAGSFQAGFTEGWESWTGSRPLPIPGMRSSEPSHSSQSPQ